ncbi:MAG TPA: bifunctional indole-3-glycerol phosphate synthase/phosphoribosylanthranilate isomerase, partial [Corynebacterium sp.]|nr:bifunctional indole-3-glycerol phosphate synthase/phosphoribosylanthranilate isomerase [Corynebacterium sp.]
SAIPAEVKQKALLAGGLGASNVHDALTVGCLGLDLNSGVEYPAGAGEWAGRKDSGALRTVFAAIRGFSYE